MTNIPRPVRPLVRPLAAMAVLSAFAFGLAGTEGRALASNGDGASTGAAVPGIPLGNDVICGPRCVGFLLEYYGRPEPLDRLVREIQSPDFEKGATLAQVDGALRTRGIFTAPLRLAPDAVLASPYPVVIHLRQETGGPSVGHYALWLPGSNEGECLVWSGLPGLQAGPWDKLRPRMSGVVLLTSRGPIANPMGLVRRSSWLRRWWERPIVEAVLLFTLFSSSLVCMKAWSSRRSDPLRRPLYG